MKTHDAAVVVIPERDLWEPIQAIRQRYDRHFDRWMPHITLLYPFQPREMFDQADPALRRACASVPRFRATLARMHFFAHGRDRFTMWLAPDPAAPFVQLQSALQAQFPDCDDVSRHGSGFVPHLSLGQAAGRAQLDHRLAELRAGWRPFDFQVASIALLFREGEAPFAVERTMPLG
jgi:RNA 2',3'-cyclic 3'-phosphodiesterase